MLLLSSSYTFKQTQTGHSQSELLPNINIILTTLPPSGQSDVLVDNYNEYLQEIVWEGCQGNVETENQ